MDKTERAAIRDSINDEIDMLIADLKELQDNREYDEPGIYYEQESEAQRIARKIEDLLHELHELPPYEGEPEST